MGRLCGGDVWGMLEVMLLLLLGHLGVVVDGI